MDYPYGASYYAKALEKIAEVADDDTVKGIALNALAGVWDEEED